MPEDIDPTQQPQDFMPIKKPNFWHRFLFWLASLTPKHKAVLAVILVLAVAIIGTVIYFVLAQNQFTFDMYAAEDFDRLDQIRHQPNLRNDFGKNPFKIRKHAYRMKFLGSNLNSEIVSEKKLPYYKN